MSIDRKTSWEKLPFSFAIEHLPPPRQITSWWRRWLAVLKNQFS